MGITLIVDSVIIQQKIWKLCEIYECVICDNKILQLVNLKTHFKENHDTCKMDGPSVGVRHIKQSREYIDIYDQQYLSYQDAEKLILLVIKTSSLS